MPRQHCACASVRLAHETGESCAQIRIHSFCSMCVRRLSHEAVARCAPPLRLHSFLRGALPTHVCHIDLMRMTIPASA